MGRILGLLLLLGLGWLIVRRVVDALAPPRAQPKSSSPPNFEKTVRCARCGVHLPLPLARQEGDGHVCTDTDCENEPKRTSRDPGRQR